MGPDGNSQPNALCSKPILFGICPAGHYRVPVLTFGHSIPLARPAIRRSWGECPGEVRRRRKQMERMQFHKSDLPTFRPLILNASRLFVRSSRSDGVDFYSVS
jgi:hypothetical protein